MRAVEVKNESYEETYVGHAIFVEPNRDPYGGGFEWSVCKDDIELECGLDFTVDEALKSARKYVDGVDT